MVFTKFFNKTKTKHVASSHGDRQQTRSIKRNTADTQEAKRHGKKKSASRPTSSRQQRDCFASGKKRQFSSTDASCTPGNKGEQHRPNKKKRAPPSQAALELSQRLKELSKQKNLKESLQILNDPSNNIDEHHTCIVVDCCSRCGDVDKAEAIVRSMEDSGKHVNVETKTALLKGFSHSGQLQKSETYFEPMCSKKIPKKDRANIRSLNTVLRGCLWSAAVPTSSDLGSLAGGVASSEKAWKLYQSLDDRTLDASSYEYSISLLCQALRVKEAERRIEEMKTMLGVDIGFSSSSRTRGSQSDMESVAVSYLGLSRAFSLLGYNEKAINTCECAHRAIIASRNLLQFQDGGAQISSKRQGKHAEGNHGQTGGKRSWRENSDSAGTNRSQSNSLFRSHRLSEVQADTEAVKAFCESEAQNISARTLSRRLLTRLLILSGGGTTELDKQVDNNEQVDVCHSNKTLQRQLVNTAYFSFGLSQLGLLDMPPKAAILNKRECNKILGSVGLQGGVVSDGGSGVINFTRIFSSHTGNQTNRQPGTRKRNRPVDVELGAGFGDWIVNQARSNPSRDYVAVELRADRAWQIFARATLTPSPDPVDNLCVVGADSGNFLRNHVENGKFETIFVNHPEPPTQTYGAEGEILQSIMDGAEEPAHMLTCNTLDAAGKCLSQSRRSRLVIVTDNRWYAQLLCATLVKLLRKSKGSLVSVLPSDEEATKLSVSETFPSRTGNYNLDKVVLYEGQPNKLIRHAQSTREGGSYFDRLWRTGAGTHAEQRIRYVILMKRKMEDPESKEK